MKLTEMSETMNSAPENLLRSIYLIAKGAVNGVKDIGNWQCAQVLQINAQRFDQCISCGVFDATGVQQLSQLEQERRRLLSQQEETLFRNK